MNFGPLLDAALAAQEVYESAGLRGCVIGGIALQRWGEPRYTAAVDISILVEAGQEAKVTQLLLARFTPRISAAADFAARARVILARTESGVGIDIALAGLPYEVRVVERSSAWDLGGARLRTCSAEDLLVMKTFAGRDKDWADVTGILERQGRRLDLDLVRRELNPLLAAKEAPELAQELERRIAQIVK